MFLARRANVLPDSVIEAGKADGFIHICEQAALMFGSDRREPTAHRPVVAIRDSRKCRYGNPLRTAQEAQRTQRPSLAG